MMTAMTIPHRILIVLSAFLGLAAPSVAPAQETTRVLSEDGEWTMQAGPEEGTAEFDLSRARRLLAERNYGAAREAATDFLEAHPTHVLVPEAYLVRADATYLGGNEYKALYDYEAICKQYAGSEAFAIALEREFEIAQWYAQGNRRKLWGMRITTAYTEAEELLIRIQERAPGSRLAQKAGRALADLYFARRQMDMAATAYDIYLINHGQTAEDTPEAMSRLIYSNLAMYRGPEHDPSSLYNAREIINRLEARSPGEARQLGISALRARIDESDASGMLTTAKWYLDRSDEVACRFQLRRLLRRYPETAAGVEAYRMLVERGWEVEEPARSATGEVLPGAQPEEGTEGIDEGGGVEESAVEPSEEGR